VVSCCGRAAQALRRESRVDPWASALPARPRGGTGGGLQGVGSPDGRRVRWNVSGTDEPATEGASRLEFVAEIELAGMHAASVIDDSHQERH
jgi:hypothetical protein